MGVGGSPQLAYTSLCAIGSSEGYLVCDVSVDLMQQMLTYLTKRHSPATNPEARNLLVDSEKEQLQGRIYDRASKQIALFIYNRSYIGGERDISGHSMIWCYLKKIKDRCMYEDTQVTKDLQ
jgi:hypothetical protein